MGIMGKSRLSHDKEERLIEPFLSSVAQDHRFGVRGIERSDVRWRGRSGRELLRPQA